MGSSVYHWLSQRVTAFIMLPFSVWFFYKFLRFLSIVCKSVSELDLSFVELNTIDVIASVCFFIIAFYHAILGLQVILEDYVQSSVLRVSILLLIKGIVTVTLLFLIFAIFNISLNF
ncbi:succinate dehydrogenase, hydrophobic membrane anchor protein [Ehrlichia ruminantium]|uniref:succinate dehydrogenase, hydrophobic membrane anchor protein n=1 Tax=Ehrlichia ruminantium TaxID=779 RepID=UPI0015DD0CA2|nr:succinate dehydrogenase, hydrophobic membrane anchor protein [Ehrlichia ruminantium]QLK50267.1 succinate dehydrogenase, hydrophobic membrane anchor protein [Ehrlichia ruminantium]QLK51191.1 succinate dehydrogenase, hydrophobic membrane anchor protein [Ehrlichia ruminantium]QLK53026.1 succinate dehydrogenase, hydrophobic membrane anchor protein [Ehrlichia ruminantium]QLK58528.1 succinate dehydrogenase, hydrophobic membrane anchor protein [Ehrlichia ruminantium]UOD98973.1 succinate dehydrogen